MAEVCIAALKLYTIIEVAEVAEVHEPQGTSGAVCKLAGDALQASVRWSWRYI